MSMVILLTCCGGRNCTDGSGLCLPLQLSLL